MDIRETYRIELFGGLSVLQGGRIIGQFRSSKPASLLAYLARYRQQVHSREVLAETLWPDDSQKASRQNLDVSLCRLRKELEDGNGKGSSLILADRSGIHLHPDLFVTDIEEFEASLRSAEAEPSHWRRAPVLTAAVEKHGNGFLPGFYD